MHALDQDPLSALGLRVERLEAHNRRLRSLLVALCALAGGLFVIGWTVRGPAQKLTASELSIVDADGHTRAFLGCDSLNGTRLQLISPRLDAGGQPVMTGFVVCLGKNDRQPYMIIANEERMVMHIRFTEIGTPQMVLGGISGFRTLLGTNEENSAGLEVIDNEGNVSASIGANASGRRWAALARRDTLLWRVP